MEIDKSVIAEDEEMIKLLFKLSNETDDLVTSCGIQMFFIKSIVCIVCHIYRSEYPKNLSYLLWLTTI